MIEKFIHFIKVITYQEYRELKAEWERQNKDIDKLRVEKKNIIKNYTRDIMDYNERLAEKDKVYEEAINNMREEYAKDMNVIRDQLKETKKKLTDKDNKRKEATKELKAAKKLISEQEEKIKQLEEQVEFLKSHRRAPDLKELKDYTEGKKRGRKKSNIDAA